MRISLSMIVRNEGRTLERTLDSIAQYVDEIVIGLAGESTDNTEEIARKFTEKVISIEWNDDFSAARNEVLSHCTGDWLIWLDGDDELIGGEFLRDLPSKHPHVGAFYFGYDYGREQDGTTHTWLWRERLVRADLNWQWRGSIHEWLATDTPHQVVRVEQIVVKHHREGKNDGGRNLRLLYKELEKTEPNPDPHLLVYLGNELAGRGQFDEAIANWNRYLKLTNWVEEAYQVQTKIGRVHALRKEFDKAGVAFLRAIQIKADWVDAYLGLAEIAFAQERWNETVEWIKAAATKEPPQTNLIVDPQDYNWKPYVLLGIAYTRLGAWHEALENLQTAFSARPSEDIAKQIRLLEDEIESEKVLYAFMKVYEHLGRHDEWLKARNLFSVAPKILEQHPAVMDAWLKTAESTAHVEDPSIMVDFYKNNPGWAPFPEELLFKPEHLEYPRLKFARDVAAKVQAKTILDFGCSDGFMSLPLARMGYRVDGVDLDPRTIALAMERSVKYSLQDAHTSFTEGDIDTVMEWVGCDWFVKYDLALVFEVIEHLADPAAFLDKMEQAANHIALTTPHLAWERGQVQDWQKVEPKSHLRIYDLVDMETTLSPRGWIHNLYREEWANGSAWIFADYTPGARTDRNIQLLAPGTLESYGPRKLRKTGLGGSETALIRLAEELAADKHGVSVYGNVDEPGYFNSVRYRVWDDFIPDVSSDLSIAWRFPEAADLDIHTKRLVLWMHDTDAGDRITPERAEKFDAIVVLSEWHKQHMLGLYPFLEPDKLVIIGNGVDKERFDLVVKREPNRVVYASSPDRGLDVILEHIWPKVVEAVPEAELHIYYGWDAFDEALSRFPHLQAFKTKLATALLNSKNVVQHGRVDQDQLAQEMSRSSIWLYPTYFHETYCITAVEAQLAGLVPITSNLAALAETVKSGIKIDGDVNDPEIQQAYTDAVIHMLKQSEDVDLRARIASKAPAQSWSEAAKKWIHLVN
jgi:glycosyltransferase involved in cell wall biosynthesis/tetratricopeptide (TPR) repeat protein